MIFFVYGVLMNPGSLESNSSHVTTFLFLERFDLLETAG